MFCLFTIECPLENVYNLTMIAHGRYLLRAAFPVISLLIAASVDGQHTPGSTLSGLVLDASTGLPLENANVFLAQTVLGTSTDEQGNFRITRIPPGTYRLVVSRVGYQKQSQSVTFGESESSWREFSLSVRILQAEEVPVAGEAQKEWRKHLREFTEKFLGTGDYATFCRITNPEVIAFRIDSISHDLMASSEDLIDVENRALGYRVYIALDMFSWDLMRDQGQYLIYPRFEPLLTQQQDSLMFWEKNREASYDQSIQHFFSSLIAGTLEQDRYDVNIGPLSFLRSGSRHAIEPGDIFVQETDLWGLKRIMFNDWLLVTHAGENGKESNYITLDQGIALVDSLGNPSDPLSVHMIGPWQERRVSDMLPLFWTRKRSGAE